jgi:N-acetylglucosamine kinase-like BadF-type ATPase
MAVFLAADGGQTSTEVVLADEQGNILGRASGGPSDHTEEPGGRERLEREVGATIARALEAACLPALDGLHFAAACFGMTGETKLKESILRSFVRTPHLMVVHDSVIALMGATAGGAGVIVIGGTGSVARGTDGQGTECRVGGWGHLFGDEGSAFWIGKEAVRAIAAEAEGFGETTQLTSVILGRLGVASAHALMERYYSGEWSRDHLAGLARWVHEVACDGDRVARSILEDAGRRLASLALTTLSLLARSGCRPSVESTEVSQSGPMAISYIGGVFESSFALSSFENFIYASARDAFVRPPLFPPVFGALLLAYQSTGLRLPDEARHHWRERA